MKSLNFLIILAATAILSAGCGTLEDGSLCQDLDGVLVCEPANGALDSQGQALFDSGGLSGSGHSYLCEDTSDGKICTCMGQLDCMRMFENECISDMDDPNYGCSGSGSGEICTCTGTSGRHTDGIGTSPYFPGGLNAR
ncbi:MAG: hypothetical protein JRJ87_22340 [Deltaproteobacteria bacterium]|nr:hypothetical protein [Deltaproteobacteria bacterium]